MRIKKDAFSKRSGYVWTGPNHFFRSFAYAVGLGVILWIKNGP